MDMKNLQVIGFMVVSLLIIGCVQQPGQTTSIHPTTTTYTTSTHPTATTEVANTVILNFTLKQCETYAWESPNLSLLNASIAYLEQNHLKVFSAYQTTVCGPIMNCMVCEACGVCPRGPVLVFNVSHENTEKTIALLNTTA